MKVKNFHVQHSNDRESRWALIQYDDGALYVNQEHRLYDGGLKAYMIPIDLFMRESGPAQEHMQTLIDRMFSYA